MNKTQEGLKDGHREFRLLMFCHKRMCSKCFDGQVEKYVFYISTCQTLVNKCFEYLLLPGGQEGEEGAWCYLEPECGAASWPSRGDCGGIKQSPIDLVTRGRSYQRPAQPLAFTGYDKVGAGHTG